MSSVAGPVSRRGIGAVVVNWRTPGLTVQSVRSLCQDGLQPKDVVVVDNGSDDGSVEALRRQLAEVTVLALQKNVGFARANNLGVQALPNRSAYLLVNSDAYVHTCGSIERLVRTLDDPRVGIAMPKLRNADLTLQPNVVPASTPLPELVRASGLSRWVPNELQPWLGTHWDHSSSRVIQAAIGAVMLVRGRTWMQLQGFDERTFMYAEDLDLCWRCRRRRWRVRFVADAEFIHLGGASAEQRWDLPQRAERVAAADSQIIRKHLPPWRARLTIALMAAGVAARAVIHRLRGNDAAAATQRGWLRGYLKALGAPPAPPE